MRQKYLAEIHYQDIKGNPRAARYTVKATSIDFAIDKAEANVRKRKHFMKSVGGDIMELSIAA